MASKVKKGKCALCGRSSDDVKPIEVGVQPQSTFVSEVTSCREEKNPANGQPITAVACKSCRDRNGNTC